LTTVPAIPRFDAPYAPREELVAPISALMNDAIAVPRLPGAVVRIGHAGTIVFSQAFGARKLGDEPALDGSPSPAEPMTEDTIFDIASLTKCLAAAGAGLPQY
jgi:CubicO group peptidase (beta-lactamase class C family)